ncbi:MAG: prolipoprotein diacylglyceryl transferase [Acidobacteria bacterium]|nr:prolipoprotein diacylglyceryl transferase [Acidobacteriota bacterium]
MLAAIPYRTFPWVGFGPVRLHTFGLMVALGVLAGTAIAVRYGARIGIERGEVTSLATRLVVAGVIGARLTWVLTHPSDIHSPLDVVALWKGGLQFSGGFVAALAAAAPRLRRMTADARRGLLDGLALGFTVGLAFGRIGCYSVGEHLGRPTGFFLAARYEGGATREGPLAVGQAIHNTALYEFIHLLVLAAVLWWLLWRARPAAPGVALGVFAVWYGVARFATDFLRAYDERALGLTGAQWLCLALVPAGIWILASARARRHAGNVPSLGCGLTGEPRAVGRTDTPGRA